MRGLQKTVAASSPKRMMSPSPPPRVRVKAGVGGARAPHATRATGVEPKREEAIMSLSSVNHGLAIEFVRKTFKKALRKIPDSLTEEDKDNLIEGLIYLTIDKAKAWGWGFNDITEHFAQIAQSRRPDDEIPF